MHVVAISTWKFSRFDDLASSPHGNAVDSRYVPRANALPPRYVPRANAVDTRYLKNARWTTGRIFLAQHRAGLVRWVGHENGHHAT